MILRSLNGQGIAGLAAAIALLGLLIVQHLDAQHWRKESDRFEKLYGDEQLAFAKTTAAYREAAETARAEDRANAERVASEQSAINERTEDDFETRLAAARLAADRLRRNSPAGPADRGAGGAAPMPGLPAAATSATESAGRDGLPATSLDDDDALIATEQAIQLDELIKWVKRQAAVDPNSAAESASH
ncbi:hypothetical protein ACUXST_001525 [Sphingomonas sp. F9_3S_D5_B_2]